jgi:hypothetical protein
MQSAPVRTLCVPDGDEHPNLLMRYPLMRERWLDKPAPNAMAWHGDAAEVADALPTTKKSGSRVKPAKRRLAGRQSSWNERWRARVRKKMHSGGRRGLHCLPEQLCRCARVLHGTRRSTAVLATRRSLAPNSMLNRIRLRIWRSMGMPGAGFGATPS